MKKIFLITASALLVSQIAFADNLPLPRFVSMKSNEANVRSGPGLNYPIDWVLKYKELPVEIIAEYEQWRRIRDSEGDEGWVHTSMISGKRTVIMVGNNALLRSKDKDSAKPLARISTGAIAELLACTESWCKMRFGEHRGWLPRYILWGIYPEERF